MLTNLVLSNGLDYLSIVSIIQLDRVLLWASLQNTTGFITIFVLQYRENVYSNREEYSKAIDNLKKDNSQSNY